MKFKRGYEVSRERIRTSPRFAMSCFNCNHYFQGEGDIEEVCQNNEVLEFDMVVEGNNIFCAYWQQCKSKNEPVKKTGRAVLD